MAAVPNPAAAASLQRSRDKVEQAIGVIDRDPEGAAALLEGHVEAAPNVGEITQGDMFRLMSQMQSQMAGMQTQIIQLMTGQSHGSDNPKAPDTKAELAADRRQRELTLKAWNDEPREPVFIHPDQDEDKIHAVTGAYTPRLFRINGLEYPVNVGEIANVPSSVARLVEYTQRRRPMQAPPQALQGIADPARGQFLASSLSQTLGNPGKSGEGQVYPDHLPPPQSLGLRYDHNGQ